MFPRITSSAACCSLILITSITLASAQAPEVKRNALDALKKQIPTDKEAAAESAEFQKKNVPAAPLPTGSPELDALRARAANLQKQHAQHLADIASGKTQSHAHLQATQPQRIADLKALTLSLEQLQSENDPTKKQLLSKAFFATLQPLGPYLENADPALGYINLLTPAQQAEHARLETAWDTAGRDHSTATEPLQFVGPGQLYTITHLSVPLIVKASPASKVILQTFGGGLFPNKLTLIELTANDAGIAQTEWVSYGDSIADTVIGLRSLSAPPAENLTITTIKLELVPLPNAP